MAKFVCSVCGYVHEGTEPPALCPICKHGQGYFIRLDMAPYVGK